MDCHIDTWIDKNHRQRAAVIHTASGKRVYTTWPYAAEASAVYRAWRWLRDEYAKWPRIGLFEQALADAVKR